MKRFSTLIIVLAFALVTISAFFIPAYAATNEQENNNTITSANSLISGTTVNARLDTSSDVDYFQFKATQNGKLTFTFGHSFYDSDHGWTVEVYVRKSGETQTTLFSFNIERRAAESSTFHALSVVSGNYYGIKVNRYYSNSYHTDANYTVRCDFTPTEYYEKEFNNTFTEANTLPGDGSFEANLYSSGDTDYFNVTPSKNGKLQFVFNHTFLDSDHGWTLEVFIRNDGGNYTALETMNIELKNAETIRTSIIGAKANTTYCIKISRYYSNSYYTSNQYYIAYSFSPTENYEREFNDSYETANALPNSTDYSANLMTSGDADFFKFTSSKSGTNTINFKHSYRDSDHGWEVYLYSKNSDGTYSQISKTVVEQKDKENVPITFTASSGTLYCVKIIRYYSNSYHTGATYSLNCNGSATAPSTTVAPTTQTTKAPVTAPPAEIPTTTKLPASTTASSPGTTTHYNTTTPATQPTTAQTTRVTTTRAPETLPEIQTETTSPDGSAQARFENQDYNIMTFNNFNYIVQVYEVLIIQYIGYDEHVEIPEKIDSYTVAGIADNAFASSPATEVVVPSSVYRFGDNSFDSINGKMKIICEENAPVAEYAQENGYQVEFQQVYAPNTDSEETEITKASNSGNKKIIALIAAACVVIAGLVAVLIVLLKKR